MRTTSTSLPTAELTFLNSYDFEYEDADDDESGDIGIENKYYNAKQLKVDNPEEAVDEFLGIPPLEQDKSEWSVLGDPKSCYDAMLNICQGFQRIKAGHQVGIQARAIWRCEFTRASQQSTDTDTNISLGRRTLPGTAHLCQIRRHAQLLRKVHQ